MQTNGIVFNIQKFSIHDGPGIRTTVFLKGCPLRCKWCANPESQEIKPQLMYNEEKCVRCGTCVRNCPQHAIKIENFKLVFDRDACIHCKTCENNCPAGAINFIGDAVSIDDIVTEVLKDKPFYEESNGGITISGGEGMSQPAFLFHLVNELKKHQLHLAIETTGYIEHELFTKLAPLFDLLLFDVKHYDREQHFLGTGVYNDLIIKNLKWALQNKIEVLPRIPVIPDFNDSLNDAKGLARLLKNIGVLKIQLLPFHQFGEKKYEMLNLEYSLKNKKALHKEDLKEYQNIFINEDIKCFF